MRAQKLASERKIEGKRLTYSELQSRRRKSASKELQMFQGRYGAADRELVQFVDAMAASSPAAGPGQSIFAGGMAAGMGIVTGFLRVDVLAVGSFIRKDDADISAAGIVHVEAYRCKHKAEKQHGRQDFDYDSIASHRRKYSKKFIIPKQGPGLRGCRRWPKILCHLNSLRLRHKDKFPDIQGIGELYCRALSSPDWMCGSPLRQEGNR